MINFKNNTAGSVQVSVNKWGSGGSTSFFKVKPKEDESWDRTDKRGFVLYLDESSHNGSYYVLAGADVILTETGVSGAIKMPSEGS